MTMLDNETSRISCFQLRQCRRSLAFPHTVRRDPFDWLQPVGRWCGTADEWMDNLALVARSRCFPTRSRCVDDQVMLNRFSSASVDHCGYALVGCAYREFFPWHNLRFQVLSYIGRVESLVSELQLQVLHPYFQRRVLDICH